MTETTEPTEVSSGTISLRATWPKTPQERQIAKGLVKQAFERFHDSENNLKWATLQVDDPGLHDQLMYFAADDMQHLYAFTNKMRSAGELPPSLARKTPVRKSSNNGAHLTDNQSNERFKDIDKFILKKHARLPMKHGGRFIDWDAFRIRYPAQWALMQSLWPGANNVVQVNFKQRVLKLSRGVSDDQPAETPHAHSHGLNDQIEAFIIEHAAEIPRNGRRIDWPEFEKQFPDILEILRQRYSGYSFRNLTSKFGKLLRELQPKGSRQVVPHRARTHVDAEPKEAAKPPVQMPTEFRFVCCPICRLDIASTEQTIQSRLTDCPRCHFQIEKAELAYVALSTIKQ